MTETLENDLREVIFFLVSSQTYFWQWVGAGKLNLPYAKKTAKAIFGALKKKKKKKKKKGEIDKKKIENRSNV